MIAHAVIQKGHFPLATSQARLSTSASFPNTLCWSVFARDVEVETLACEVAFSGEFRPKMTYFLA
jgi:hypothetical protein